jgi:dihydrofolate reductase
MENRMGKVFANLSVSLDGYFTGPNPGPSQGLGEGGEILHAWLEEGTGSREELTANDVVRDMFESGGAMICGRDGYEAAEKAWGPEPPFRVPVFVLTHRTRPDDVRRGTTFHFVDEGFAAALRLAREAAGAKDVSLHGGSIIRQALAAGALDELQLQMVPVLLGAGNRLFESGGTAAKLELLRVIEAPGATHLKYRVLR